MVLIAWHRLPPYAGLKPYAELMPRLGIRDGQPLGDPLVVDITTAPVITWDELWDALQKPCGLPGWFGRNLDAWNDTLGTGAISEVLDAHPYLIVRVLGQGLFAPGNANGLAFAEVTALTGRGLVEIHQ
jgi:hypothetical protein